MVAAVTAVLAAMAAGARRLGLAAIGVGLVLGATSAAIHVAAIRSGPVANAARQGAHASLTIRLVRDPVQLTSNRGFRFILADATVTSYAGRPVSSPVLVLTHGASWLGLLPGQRLSVTGSLRPPRNADPVAAVVLVAGPTRLIGRPPWWQRLAGHVRAGLRAACARLPADERGLVPGLVIGDVSSMPPELTASFRVAGLTHLNAVSGENLAIVLATVAAVVRRVGMGRRGRTAATAIALVGFVILARPSPSVLRAAVMGLIVVVAGLVGRRTQALPSLAFAVLALVVVDPFLARTPGFALSVLATAAIVTLAPRFTAALSKHMPRTLAVAIAVPAAAQLVCTPVIVGVFGQLSPYAVVANLLAGPAVAPATVAGVLSAVAGVLWQPAAVALAWVAAVPAGWLAFVARGVGKLPGAGVRLPSGWPGVMLLLGCGVVVAVIARVRRPAPNRAMLTSWPG
jgi:competence protein ComEC